MTHPNLSSYQGALVNSRTTKIKSLTDFRPTSNLAERITKEASKQTYYTIRTLADRAMAADAYRAYAYFRWVDDMLDQDGIATTDRLAFLHRQQDLMTDCYAGKRPFSLQPEEQLLADLIANHPTKHYGLHLYLDQMMAVMAFDVQRKGKLISLGELNDYTHSLAVAVTEALHFFIGNGQTSPQDETRYLAVTGAHITHMLRDTIEDTAVGYYNIPADYLAAHHITPIDVHHPAYCTWVKSRVHLARHYFHLGRATLQRVENWRCRLAGYAYIARFAVVLDAIEKDDYFLREAYPERKSKKAGAKMAATAVSQTCKSFIHTTPPNYAVQVNQ